MDHHLAMARATSRRNAKGGSAVGVGWWATGEYGDFAIDAVWPGVNGRALSRIVSFFFQFGELFYDFSTFWQSDLVRYNTFVEEQY